MSPAGSVVRAISASAGAASAGVAAVSARAAAAASAAPTTRPSAPNPSSASCRLPRLLLVLLLLIEQLLPLGLVEEAEGGRGAGRVEQHPFPLEARLGELDVGDVHDAVEALHAVQEERHVLVGAAHLHLDRHLGVEVVQHFGL